MLEGIGTVELPPDDQIIIFIDVGILVGLARVVLVSLLAEEIIEHRHLIATGVANFIDKPTIAEP